RDLFDVTFLRQSLQRLPARLLDYWTTFTDMEFECIRRTLCDLADFTTRHVPQWFNQILVIYFNTFSANNDYYQAVTNGLVTHTCPLIYNRCDPKSFMDRI